MFRVFGYFRYLLVTYVWCITTFTSHATTGGKKRSDALEMCIVLLLCMVFTRLWQRLYSRVDDVSLDLLDGLLELGERCLHAVVRELVVLVLTQPVFDLSEQSTKDPSRAVIDGNVEVEELKMGTGNLGS